MTKRKPKEEHKKDWRPTVMDRETLQKLEEAFSMGCSDLESCLHAWIWKSTLYNYQNENPEFVERKEILKEHTIKLARSTVVKAIESNPDIALKYLERKRKSEFSTRTENTWVDWWPIQLEKVMREDA